MIRPRIAVSAGIALAATILIAPPASGFEPRLIKESFGAKLATSGCPLATSTDGTAANYRWYNLCSGYLWLFSGLVEGEAFGVLYGGAEQPEVNDSNMVKRVITYFRNVASGYTDEGVDVFVDQDFEGDGCPDVTWLSDTEFLPAMRWNCSEFNAQIPQGISHLVIRTKVTRYYPTIVTDGPYSRECDPPSTPRSYYYGLDGSACLQWIGPDGTDDNFLYWLILDRGAANATQPSTWGAIKGLFR
ncbi:MAG: hypothetical protein ACKVU1_17670 [bacterium]